MFGSLRGRRVTVMGLGRFGGGVGAVRSLVEQGARVTVTDLAGEDQLVESLDAIADLRLERLRLGAHIEDDFRDAELIVASPAVPRDHPLLRSSRVPVTTEVGLFWSRCRGRVIGVTGTVGKSTTAAMIQAVLSSDGNRAWLGGNIGGSLLADVERIAADDFVVLELSSFQLEYLEPLRPRAEVAVITNFHPNHLDRHGTVEAYRAAKQSLLRWQSPRDFAVLNLDDPDVSTWPSRGRIVGFGVQDMKRHLPSRDRQEAHPDGPDHPTVPSREGRRRTLPDGRGSDIPRQTVSCTLGFGTPPVRRAVAKPAETSVLLAGSDLLFADGAEPTRLPLPNRRGPAALNAAAAGMTGMVLGIGSTAIIASLNSFRGLPHRFEEVGRFDGRVWINDSKATTPEAAIAALQAIDAPVRLVAGGADKGVDLRPLAAAIHAKRAHAYLSGQTAATIASLLAGHVATVARFGSFDESVRAACSDSLPGEVILLSPGCASWGQFADYRARGDRFRELARETTC